MTGLVPRLVSRSAWSRVPAMGYSNRWLPSVELDIAEARRELLVKIFMTGHVLAARSGRHRVAGRRRDRS